MKLGILECGAPPEGLGRFGSYAAMFRRLLGEYAHHYEVFDVRGGALPASPERCAGYLISGSASGVYDGLPWIDELKTFLVAARGQAALVGICFGHQVMAEAFGGKVIKSPNGWGVGVQCYDVVRPQTWMDGAAQIRLPASHQDQVVEVPASAVVIAGNAFAPYGALAYADQPAISIQLHPEFEPDYATALVEMRRGRALSEEQADRAIASLAEPTDRARAGRWINTFLGDAVT